MKEGREVGRGGGVLDQAAQILGGLESFREVQHLPTLLLVAALAAHLQADPHVGLGAPQQATALACLCVGGLQYGRWRT